MPYRVLVLGVVTSGIIAGVALGGSKVGQNVKALAPAPPLASMDIVEVWSATQPTHEVIAPGQQETVRKHGGGNWIRVKVKETGYADTTSRKSIYGDVNPTVEKEEPFPSTPGSTIDGYYVTWLVQKSPPTTLPSNTFKVSAKSQIGSDTRSASIRVK
jgi:hypothetical protein